MAQIRPNLQLAYGRSQMPLRVDIRDLLVGDPVQTILSADIASGSGTLTVKNISGFAVNQVLLIGEPGTQQAEIINTHASTAPSGSTVTLAANTVLNHSSSTVVYVLPFDQVEFSRATTATGSKSVLATTAAPANQRYTEYNDTTNTSGYYFARFKNSISTNFSSYSDYVQYAGLGTNAAGTIIKMALLEVNKQKSSVLTDEFLYSQLDLCQSEVLRELKRWSFMQKFDTNIGQLTTGQWRIAVPTDQDDQNTFKSVYNIRMGTKSRLVKVDKEKFDEFLYGVSYSTLAAALNISDTSITLTDSSDFGSTGTVTINGNSYTFTANNTSTNVLTISTTITSSNTAALGDYCFEGASTGQPKYVTTYGGYFYVWPIVSSDYSGLNLYEDYYSAQVQIQNDNTNVVFPDPSVAVYYLCWKILKRLANGEEDDSTLSYKTQYEQRKQMMKNKEVLGKTFKMRPRVQDFNTQTAYNANDSKSVRLGAFSNTGF